MGEYVWTTFEIGGKLKADAVAELAKILNDFEDYPNPLNLDERLRAGTTNLSVAGEQNYGNHEGLEAFCAKHRLVYVKTWAAQGGCFDAGIQRLLADGTIIESGADDDGRATISLQDLQAAKKREESLDEVIAALARFSEPVPPLAYAESQQLGDDPLGLACVGGAA